MIDVIFLCSSDLRLNDVLYSPDSSVESGCALVVLSGDS